MAAGPYQYPTMVRSNGKATAALVLGIIGIFICPIVCSVLAIIFGYSARNEIAASGGAQTGESYALAGIILGWVGLAIHAIWLTIVIIAVAASSNSLLIPFFAQ